MIISFVYERGRIFKNRDEFFIDPQHVSLLSDFARANFVEKIKLFSSVEETKKIPKQMAKLSENNLEIVELHSKDNSNSIKLTFLRYYENMRILQGELLNSDVIIIWIPSYTGFLAALVSSRYSLPFVILSGADWRRRVEDTFSWKGLKRTLMKYPLIFIAELCEWWMVRNSRFILTHSANIRRYKKKDVYNALPETSLNGNDFFYRDLQVVFNKKKQLLYVGKLSELKNIDLLIIAFGEIKHMLKNKELQLIIVGNGPKDEELKELASKLNILDSVTFTGYIKQGKKLWQIYRNSDFFIMPSRAEGFPRVIYEAMSQGLPVITTNVGDIPNRLQNRRDALLIPPNLTSAIVSAIISLINNPNLICILRKNGYTIAKEIFKQSSGEKLARLVGEYFC